MKNYLLILVLILIVLILGIVFSLNNTKNTDNNSVNESIGKEQDQDLENVVIKMQDDNFVPEKITIKKNQTVVFINESKEDKWPASNIHPTHQIYSEFDPKKPVPPNTSWSFKFDKVGIWRFHDHLFPRLTGVITVEQ